MFNMAGEVLGVVSHIISKSGGFEGLGFAVAANVATRRASGCATSGGPARSSPMAWPRSWQRFPPATSSVWP